MKRKEGKCFKVKDDKRLRKTLSLRDICDVSGGNVFIVNLDDFGKSTRHTATTVPHYLFFVLGQKLRSSRYLIICINNCSSFRQQHHNSIHFHSFITESVNCASPTSADISIGYHKMAFPWNYMGLYIVIVARLGQ